MPALFRGEASDCNSSTKLDLFTTVNGVLTDVYSLEFEIYENISVPGTPLKVYPSSGRAVVNVTDLCPTGEKLSTGHYVALYTPPINGIVGTHEIRWYFKLNALAPEQSLREEFEVVSTDSTEPGYTTVEALRGEGVTEEQASDARLLRLIELYSRQIDRWTGRWFEPREQTLLVDGHGGSSLLLDVPIIDIDEVRILDFDDLTGDDASAIDMAAIRVYNRHITQQLLSPDDRDNPRLEWVSAFGRQRRYGVTSGYWPPGVQNVRLDGVFGYTDPDGSAYGRTPLAIEHATQLLVIRNLATLGDVDARNESRMTKYVTSLRTRDQSITWSSPGGINSTRNSGAFSGDPEIDEIVAQYCRPPMMGAV